MTYPYIFESARQVRDRFPDRFPRPHPSVVLGDEPRVSFYCGDKSHDPWAVASFIYVAREGVPGAWAESAYYPTRNGSAVWIGFNAGVQLMGDKPADPDDPLRFYDPDFRITYKLRCRPCHESIPRRSDKLDADLTEWWRTGVLEISLALYAARLRLNA